MSTVISRVGSLLGGTAQVKFMIITKDLTDAALVDKYGDIIINPTGFFNDPNDNAYPKFYVNAGDIIPFFTKTFITAQFEDSSLTIDEIQKKAKLWGDAVQTDIQNKIIALRALTDTTTGNATVTI